MCSIFTAFRLFKGMRPTAYFAPSVTLIVDGATLPIQDAFEWQNLLNLLFLGVVASAACFVT